MENIFLNIKYMKILEILLIIFFLFLIINHVLNKTIFPTTEYIIESMTCNSNKSSKESECLKKRMDENKNTIIDTETTINDMISKITELISTNKKQITKINETKKNIIKLKNSEEGRGVDNSDACSKHPEAC